MRGKRAGFTLIELSLVITIIGMLIGGVLGARELMRSSAVNSIGADIGRFRGYYNTFKLKYDGIPGDLRNAYDFFGATCGGNAIATFNAQANCNGDGNGNIDHTPVGAGVTEGYHFWQHLALAGLIPGNYTGMSADGNSTERDAPEINVPCSRISGVCYRPAYGFGKITGNTWWFDGYYPNMIEMGKEAGPMSGSGAFFNAFLEPSEASVLDVKYDDGRPALGKLRTRTSAGNPYCTTSDVPSLAEYKLDETDQRCSLNFTLQ